MEARIPKWVEIRGAVRFRRIHAWRRSRAGCAGLLGVMAISCSRSPAGTEISKIRPIWSTPLEAAGAPPGAFLDGEPAAADGRVFIDVVSGITSLDVSSGSILWHRGLPRRAGAWNIVLSRGLVLVADARQVSALDQATGIIQWATTAGMDSVNGGRAYMAADSSQMYVSTRDRQLVALRLTDGVERWRARLGEGWTYRGVPTGVSTSGDSIYVAVRRDLSRSGHLTSGVVVALDRDTGRELWRYESPGTRSTVNAYPVVAGRLLLLSDPDSASLYAIDRFTGERVWRVVGNTNYVGPHAPAVVADDTAYVGSKDTWVYAIALPGGRLLWKTQTAASIGRVALCGRYLLVNNGLIEVLDRFTGRVVSRSSSSSEAGAGAIPFSGFAVRDDRAVVVTSADIRAFSCNTH